MVSYSFYISVIINVLSLDFSFGLFKVDFVCIFVHMPAA